MKKLSLLKIVSMYKAIAVFLAFALISLGCEQKDKQSMEKEHQYTNELIHETSPYLLQHAHNPVNWRAWNEETLALAKKENKLLLISVGYAACHWCHVMERESFEDSTVAAMMNEHFINVKVDREERPDVDQIYMNAVQLLTGRGGWPLNCIALPDGRPIWGGTYFPKENWMKALEQLASLYAEEPEKAEEYAQKLTEGVQQTGLVQLNEAEADFNLSQLDSAVSNWRESLDPNYGGRKGAPKFPMPVNLEFLLRYGVQKQDQALLDYVDNSLTKMAYGGIFDQVGGGFARYSVDDRWHIPHFEKMLYDNAQLVSLYAKAYKVFDKALYKEVVYRTVDFVEKELYNGKGAFYSSLDADSDNAEGELEEGAYYVWTKEELKGLLGEEMEIFSKYYNINAFGKWEEDKYHLIRSVGDEVFAKENDLELSVLAEKRESWIATLDREREKRDRPRLDDKTLTSWNALMLQGYVDAYAAFGDERFLNMAKTNANFILNQLVQEDGGLYRNYKNGQSTLDAYLEDYAIVVQAFIGLYEQTLEASWLHTAKQLTDYCYDHFYDAQSKMFYFTSDREKSLITRKIETEDNVIPSSNAIMAHNLFKLGHYFDQKRMKENASAMLNNMSEMALQYGGGYAHWLDLFSNYNGEFYEIAVVGEAATERVKEISSQYLPNAMIVGSLKESSLPLLQYKYNEGETTIYVCIDGACKLPVKETAKALEQVSLSF